MQLMRKLESELVDASTALNTKTDSLKIKSAVAKQHAEAASGLEVVSPCFPPGSRWHGRTLVSDGTSSLDGPGKKDQEVTFVGLKTASPAQCRAFADQILEMGAEWAVAPCAFNGVCHPKLLNAFPRDSELYAFSLFHDRTFSLGMPNTFSLDDLKNLANKVCAGEYTFDCFSSVVGAVDTLTRNPQCFGA